MNIFTKLKYIGFFLLLVVVAILGYKAITQAYQTMIGGNECIQGELDLDGVLKLESMSEPPTDPTHYSVYINTGGNLSIKSPTGTIEVLTQNQQ